MAKFAEEFDKQRKSSKNPSMIDTTEERKSHEKSLRDDGENKDEYLEFIEKEKKKKIEIQKAILKFNTKPNVGLKHLFTLGYLKEE